MYTVDVAGALTAAGYERDVIERIIAMLTQAEAAVRRSKDITPVPASSYGNSATAAELGVHSSKAHTHITDAMTQMVAGLENYHVGVKRFREDAHDTDARNAQDLGRVTSRAEQVDTATLFRRGDACNGPANFHTAPAAATCEAPTDGGDQ
jgi:hypothetical protein